MAEYTGNGYKDESVKNKNAVSAPQVRIINQLHIFMHLNKK